MPKLQVYLQNRIQREQELRRQAAARMAESEEIINILTGEEAVKDDRPEESN